MQKATPEKRPKIGAHVYKDSELWANQGTSSKKARQQRMENRRKASEWAQAKTTQLPSSPDVEEIFFDQQSPA